MPLLPSAAVVVQMLPFAHDAKARKRAHSQAVEGDLRVHPPKGRGAEAAGKEGVDEPAEHRMAQEPPAWPRGWPIAPQPAVDRPKRSFECAYHHAPYIADLPCCGSSGRRGPGAEES